jgi:hypothetical protein
MELLDVKCCREPESAAWVLGGCFIENCGEGRSAGAGAGVVRVNTSHWLWSSNVTRTCS